jgi:hypothetical protein
LPAISQQIKDLLGQDKLLEVLVTLDFELEKLESRKEELKTKMEARKKHLSSER